MEITPINGHLLIEPLKHQTFMEAQKDMYEEIGVVVAVPEKITNAYDEEKPKVGDKVFFDSWLAAKYPKEGTDEYFWLVKFDDIRAISHA